MKFNYSPRKIAFALLIGLAALQLFRPDRNMGEAAGEHDIFHFTQVPGDVKQILETSCFDCHSDHTNYPWYTNIQPVGLWLQHHVDEGKRELNFSRFTTYKPKRQKHKMEEIIELVREGEMPLESYTLIHGKAKLNPAQQRAVIQWAESEYQSMEAEGEDTHP